jgi:hypothetical protein
LKEEQKKRNVRKRLDTLKNQPPNGNKRVSKKRVQGAIPNGLAKGSRKKPGPKAGSKRKPKQTPGIPTA